MTKLIEIRLFPTLWYCDFWIYDDRNQLAKKLSKRYGASIDYYIEHMENDECYMVDSTNKSDLKGEKRIVVNIVDTSDECIIHEANHAVYALFEKIGVKDYPATQEFHSYFLEYIYTEVKRMIK